MSPADSQNLQDLHDLLMAHLNMISMEQGFGLGIVTAGGWLLVGFLRSVFSDRDE